MSAGIGEARRRRLGPLALVAAIVLGWAAPAAGHTRSESFSTWTLDGRRLAVTFTVSAHRATLLATLDETPGPLAERLAEHLSETVTVRQGASDCVGQPPRALPAARGYLRQRVDFACPADVRLRATGITVGAFFPLSAGHVHLARIELPDGAGFERVLDGERTTIAIPPRAPPFASGFTDLLALGVTHVLGGPDHLAFLLALLLACAGVRALVGVVTAFTVGHSLSLALVVLGRLEPTGPAVEALIGASIALAACEALATRWPMPRRVPLLLSAGLLAAMAASGGDSPLPAPVWLGLAAFVGWTPRPEGEDARGRSTPGGALRSAPLLAAVFGLVHGAGFADALRPLAADGAGLAAGLLAFNAGVELGQLVVVVPTWLLGAAVARRAPRVAAGLVAPAASLLVGLGVFWFVERALPT